VSAIQLNDKRQIVIELSWLLSALDDEQKRELVDSLACEESIIADVSAQLLDGWTERSSHGARSCGEDAEPSTALDRARRELGLRAGEVAQQQIDGLKRSLISAKAMQDYYSKGYYAAYHNWPEGRGMCPALGPIPINYGGEYEVVKVEPKAQP